MKKQRGLWYWLSVTNFSVFLGSILGWFGRDAEDEAQTAANDMAPALPVVLALGLVLLAVLVVYGLYVLLA